MTGFYEEFRLSKNALYSVFQGKVEEGLFFPPFFFLTYNTKFITIKFSRFKCFSSEKLNTFFFPTFLQGVNFYIFMSFVVLSQLLVLVH